MARIGRHRKCLKNSEHVESLRRLLEGDSGKAARGLSQDGLKY